MFCFVIFHVNASDLDTVGVTLLRQADPALNGAGVKVGQVEGTESPTDVNVFEAIAPSTSRSTNLFTYYSALGTGGGYPNTVGSGSSHATSVGSIFYGAYGVATNTSRMDNYEAGFFFNNKVNPNSSIPAAIVNHSVLFDASDQSVVDPGFDDYAAARKTLFVFGAGNSGSIGTNPPATSFNGITVGVYPGNSSYGPTSDGRCKPDLISPGSGATSFAAPFVAGSAALLWQAGARGDGGANTASLATNAITIKALLLNGAIKPADWTNGPITPLDARYGAGLLNVFNSWNQLRTGKRAAIETTTVSSGGAHPPGANAGNEASNTGWDYSTLSTSSSQDQIKHYYFNLTGSNSHTLTATLVWAKQQNRTTVNNLDLFLFNTANSNLVLSSTSAINNVEHLFIPKLAPGRYDLQVMKRGSGQLTSSETYALAFEFFSMTLGMTISNGNAVLSWTNIPTGFRLVSAPGLTASSTWTTVNAASVGLGPVQNTVTVPLTGASQLFRLQRP